MPNKAEAHEKEVVAVKGTVVAHLRSLVGWIQLVSLEKPSNATPKGIGY